MNSRLVFRDLARRKLFQWAVAYLAAAWVVLQVLELLGSTFAWPAQIQQAATVFVGVAFLAALVVAWYHGEKGAQRVIALEGVIPGISRSRAGDA